MAKLDEHVGALCKPADYSQSPAVDGQVATITSEMATTYDEHSGCRSRSESGASLCSDDGCKENGHGGERSAVRSDVETELLCSCDPCGVAPLPRRSSQGGTWMCLSETAEEDDMLPPAHNGLLMHPVGTAADLCEQARGFSSHSNPHVIQTICRERVPGWFHLTSEDVLIDQIMTGLSNQLFRVKVREDFPQRTRFSHPHVLFRVYGKDVSTLYDPETELRVFKKLASRNAAPNLIAEFEGGRIEEWIDGSALLVTDMKKSQVIAGIAAILAGIHQVDLSHVIDKTPCIRTFLERWRRTAMDIYKSVGPDHPSYLAMQRLGLDKLYSESFKLEQLLFPREEEAQEASCATRLAFCHNDVQENNILVSDTCMRLIDFEYSGYNYPAYDMASYFWEMTCDYCVDSYPFFHIDPTRYPRIEKRRLFAAAYLSSRLRRDIRPTDFRLVDPVVHAAERFQLATHMLWAFWAVIRAPQAATATSFDMLCYAQKRIDAYWEHKAKLIAQGLIFDSGPSLDDGSQRK